MKFHKDDEVLLKHWTYDIYMSREANDLRFMYVGCVGFIVDVEDGKFLVKFEGQYTVSFSDPSVLRKVL